MTSPIWRRICDAVSRHRKYEQPRGDAPSNITGALLSEMSDASIAVVDGDVASAMLGLFDYSFDYSQEHKHSLTFTKEPCQRATYFEFTKREVWVRDTTIRMEGK